MNTEKEFIINLINSIHITMYNKLKGKIFMQLESSIGHDKEQLEATKNLIQRILKNSTNHLEDELKIVAAYVNSL